MQSNSIFVETILTRRWGLNTPLSSVRWPLSSRAVIDVNTYHLEQFRKVYFQKFILLFIEQAITCRVNNETRKYHIQEKISFVPARSYL